ncbi:MAG: hypothetical protein ACYSWZ_11185 [Planctomycetota bacterium]
MVLISFAGSTEEGIVVLLDALSFIRRREGKLSQSFSVNTHLIDSEALTDFPLPIEDHAFCVEVQIESAEDTFVHRRDKFANLARPEVKLADIAAEIVTAVDEVGVVVARLVCVSFDEQQFAAVQQGIVPDECFVLQSLEAILQLKDGCLVLRVFQCSGDGFDLPKMPVCVRIFVAEFVAQVPDGATQRFNACPHFRFD